MYKDVCVIDQLSENEKIMAAAAWSGAPWGGSDMLPYIFGEHVQPRGDPWTDSGGHETTKCQQNAKHVHKILSTKALRGWQNLFLFTRTNDHTYDLKHITSRTEVSRYVAVLQNRLNEEKIELFF